MSSGKVLQGFERGRERIREISRDLLEDICFGWAWTEPRFACALCRDVAVVFVRPPTGKAVYDMIDSYLSHNLNIATDDLRTKLFWDAKVTAAGYGEASMLRPILTFIEKVAAGTPIPVIGSGTAPGVLYRVLKEAIFNIAPVKLLEMALYWRVRDADLSWNVLNPCIETDGDPRQQRARTWAHKTALELHEAAEALFALEGFEPDASAKAIALLTDVGVLVDASVMDVDGGLNA